MTKKFLLCLIFFSFSPLLIFCLFFIGDAFKNGAVLGESVSLSPKASTTYSSLPLNNKIVLPSIKGEDSTLVIIENYLERYNSPLFDFSEMIVETAEKNNLSPLLIVAIGQQESNLGKNTPPGCYNAWGWGIHAQGTKCYESWPEAIESVTSGIAKSYCAKGYCEDPCVMMQKYTPRSNGSWCAGVKQFLTEMETGDF